MRAAKLITIWSVALLCALPCHAQQNVSREYIIKAATLYNICRYIEWPIGAFSSADAPLGLVILGQDPFGESIQAIAGKQVRGRNIEISYIDTLQDFHGGHILFISRSAASEISSILKFMSSQPILTVGDMDNFAELGGMINFYIENNRIRFDINADEAENANLKISSNLMKLGNIVETGSAR